MLPRKVCKNLQGCVLNTFSKLVPMACTWDPATGLRWCAQSPAGKHWPKHGVRIRTSCKTTTRTSGQPPSVHWWGSRGPQSWRQVSPRLHPALSNLPGRALHLFSFHNLRAWNALSTLMSSRSVSCYAGQEIISQKDSFTSISALPLHLQDAIITRTQDSASFRTASLVTHHVSLTQYGPGGLGSTVAATVSVLRDGDFLQNELGMSGFRQSFPQRAGTPGPNISQSHLHHTPRKPPPSPGYQ